MTHSCRQRQSGAIVLHGHVDGVLRPSDDWRCCEGDGKVGVRTGCVPAAAYPCMRFCCGHKSFPTNSVWLDLRLTSPAFIFSNIRRSITKCPDEFVEVRLCLPRDSFFPAASPTPLSNAFPTLFSYSFHPLVGPGHERRAAQSRCVRGLRQL
jgi:hypothetical protein